MLPYANNHNLLASWRCPLKTWKLQLALKRLDAAGDLRNGILKNFLRLIEAPFGFRFRKEEFDFKLLDLLFARRDDPLPILRFLDGMGFERR